MYKIRFYDLKGAYIATHTITADYLLCRLAEVEKYCVSIATIYDGIGRWSIFDFQGHLLLSTVIA